MFDVDYNLLSNSAPITRSQRYHPNFIFRFSYCGLSDQKAAEYASVDIEQIYSWDDGEKLPDIVKRIWLYESGRKIPTYSGFDGWMFKNGFIVTPDGISYSQNEINVALFLLRQQTNNKI